MGRRAWTANPLVCGHRCNTLWATGWFTGRCATTWACRGCVWPTPLAKPLAQTCSPFTDPSASTSSSCMDRPRLRCLCVCNPTTKPAPTPWACLARGWRSRWPTTAKFWSSHPVCSKAITKTPRPRPRCSAPMVGTTPVMRGFWMPAATSRSSTASKTWAASKAATTTGPCLRPSMWRTNSSSSPSSKRWWPMATSAKKCAS